MIIGGFLPQPTKNIVFFDKASMIKCIGSEQEFVLCGVDSERIILSLLGQDKWEELSQKFFGSTSHDFQNSDPEKIEAFLCEYLHKKVSFVIMEKTENLAYGFPVYVFYCLEAKEKGE